MDSSLLCKLCEDFFDTAAKTPRLLPRCGHSLCQECLHTLLQRPSAAVCPEDGEPLGEERRTIANFPVNATFFDLLESKKRVPVRNLVVPVSHSLSSDSKTNLLNESGRDESGSDFRLLRSSDEKGRSNAPKRPEPAAPAPGPVSLSDGGYCEAHQKKRKTVCLDDDCLKLICSHCGLYGTHRVRSSDTQRDVSGRLRTPNEASARKTRLSLGRLRAF